MPGRFAPVISARSTSFQPWSNSAPPVGTSAGLLTITGNYTDIGRPLIITANDYELGLYNGDTGVVVDGGNVGPLAVFARGTDTVSVAPSRLDAVQTVHAMTVHRAQGSQFTRVSLVLPTASPLLTRELLYTAVTRARASARVLGTEQSLRAAVARPVVRASGLRERRR